MDKSGILKRIRNSLNVDEESGEEIIFFTSISVTSRKGKTVPTFTVMANDELTKKMKEFGVDYGQLNDAEKQFTDAVIEIIRQCRDRIDDSAFG
jgi:altronate dehydratase